MSHPAAGTKKARERLRRYERLLAKEKSTYGRYSDGAGKRYHVGPLYMRLGDLEGALKAFAWFEREFSDDMGDVGHDFCWALALYRAGRLEEGTRKLRQAMLLSPPVFARVLGESWTQLSVDAARDGLDADEASLIIDEYLGLWTPDEFGWALGLYHRTDFARARERHVEIERLLKHEPRGERRTQLVEEMFALARG